MKGTAKRKVVTSGRLTGRVRAEPAREQVAPHPAAAAAAAAAAACSEPAYSLYSTDSEDQVTTLHKGLDCCAALLTGILQAEKAASPSFSKAVPGRIVKSSTSTSLGKKTSKKLPTKTVQKNSQSGQCRPSTTTPRPSPRLTAPAAHSGVKLHPSRKKTRTQLQCHIPLSQTLSPAKPPPQCQTSTVTPQPQPSILLSVVQSSSHPGQLSLHQTDGVRHCDADCDKEEDEFVPVRDVNTQNTATDAHGQTRLHKCTMRMANMQLEPGQADEVPQDVDSRSSCMKVKTVQCVLEELKALIAGQGNAAELLLSHLEQTLFSPHMNDGNSVIETVPDLSSVHSQNSQLRRCVRILKQQLEEKEKSERQLNMKMLSNSGVLILQEELTTAQSRLQRLQDDLAELRKALQDTQSQLREREAENIALKTDLETTRSRLVESERVKSELAALAQQRLEEIENLNRLLERQDSSDCPTVVDSVSNTELTTKLEHRECPAEPLSDHITQYLMSLKQLDPAERKRNTVERKPLSSVSQTVQPSETLNTHIQSRCLDEVPSCGRWPERECGRLMDSTLSHCDVGSVQSDWSVTSGSTFDTRDEAAFRDGLAALDASIASLQKTIQLDLRR